MPHQYSFYSSFFSIVFWLFALGVNAQPQWFQTGTDFVYHYNQNPDLPGEPLISRQARFQVTDQIEFAGRLGARVDFVPQMQDDAGLFCRHDTSTHYFYVSNDSLFVATELTEQWQLACFFGAQPGDSWNYTVYDNEQFGSGVGEFLITVESVENVEINGVSLRQVYASSAQLSGNDAGLFYLDGPFTEIVGAMNAFILPPGDPGACDGYFNVQLQCYTSESFAYTNPDFSNCSLSANTPERLDVRVFPTPARDLIHLTFQSAQKQSLRVVDLTGRQVAEIHAMGLSDANLTVDVSSWPAGVYFVTNAAGNGAARILVQR